MSNFSKSEKEIYELRKQKIALLNDISNDSFPTKFNESTKISNIINEHRDIEEGIHTGISVTVRGRLLNARSFGKLLFYDILDQSGKIQLLVNSGEIEDVYLRLFENFDIGDIIAVNGEVIKTKKGELSIKVNQSTILSKSLRSFPEKWHGLKDIETRFRQRYLDLIVNPESKKILETRSKVIKLIREYLHENSFVEVETPILQTKAGGAIAKPFTTHHNALGLDMYLRIAPELYLKRLIIGGIDRVYELSKDFRNEGMDRNHNPEFTMLEFYWAYADYIDNMDLVENMIKDVAKSVGSLMITWGEIKIDLSKPFQRKPIFELLKEATGRDISNLGADELRKICKENNIQIEDDANYGQILDCLMSELVEPDLIQPTFVIDYPKEISPLAKKHRNGDPNLVERFELFIGSAEFANAFSELNDPIDQRERFEAQAKLGKEGDDEAHPVDENFLQAIECGMPPTGGVGIGIDRLVMLLTENLSIKDVILFPAMRKED